MLNEPVNIKKEKWKKNQVKLLSGKKNFPIRPQSAAMELKDDIRKALDVTFAALSNLNKNFISTQITLIYLPSIVTSYEWEEPISVHIYQSDGELLVTNSANTERSLLIRNSIRKFSKLNKFKFLDLTEVMKKAGREKFIHGPLDFLHLNEDGYKLVVEVL